MVPCFKHLGITFHGSCCLAGAAAPARVAAARAAMHSCQARSAALGIEAAPVQLQLFSTMVDSVLSYGAEAWGVQLAPRPQGSTGCAAGTLHLNYLRRRLGARQGTPNAAALVECGERPLRLRWVFRAPGSGSWRCCSRRRPVRAPPGCSTMCLACTAAPSTLPAWPRQPNTSPLCANDAAARQTPSLSPHPPSIPACVGTTPLLLFVLRCPFPRSPLGSPGCPGHLCRQVSCGWTDANTWKERKTGVGPVCRAARLACGGPPKICVVMSSCMWLPLVAAS